MPDTEIYVSDYTDRPLIDKRRAKYKGMTLDRVFYVVHLVSQGTATWHRVSLIASDTDEELLEGLDEVERAVVKEMNFHGKTNDIQPESLLVHPIFIRNLNADDRKWVETLEITKISHELSSLITTDPDLMRYVVVGVVTGKNAEEGPLLTDVHAKNAAIAIDRVTHHVNVQLGCEFHPLFSTIKAPITSEMFTRYNASAKNIREFVTATPVFGMMMH
jgi:hypothetical protein